MNQTPRTAEIVIANRKLKENPQALVELQAMPAVALKISQACLEPNVDIRELARLLETDSAFAVKVLSVVNSSLYGHVREISSIQQAIVVLGSRSLVQLAISIAATKLFTGVRDVGRAKQILYDHSLAVAAVAGAIVRESNLKVEPGAAFIGGIFHDIGKLVLLSVAPVAYSSFIDTPSAEVSSVEFEQSQFGTDHTTLGDCLAESWMLSGPIRSAISDHHVPMAAVDVSTLTESIYLANELVKAWGIGQSSTGRVSEPVVRWLSDSDETIRQAIRTTGTENYEETKTLFAS